MGTPLQIKDGVYSLLSYIFLNVDIDTHANYIKTANATHPPRLSQVALGVHREACAWRLVR